MSENQNDAPEQKPPSSAQEFVTRAVLLTVIFVVFGLGFRVDWFGLVFGWLVALMMLGLWILFRRVG